MVKAINFSERFFSPVQVVQLDESGNFGFLTRDESWSGPVLLFGHARAGNLELRLTLF